MEYGLKVVCISDPEHECEQVGLETGCLAQAQSMSNAVISR